KLARLLDTLAILLGVDLAQAKGHLICRRLQFALCRRPAPKREHAKFFAHEMQGLPQRASMRIWAEVTPAVILLESGKTKPRPLFREIDPDHQEPLVVTERNVVTRPVFLDQFAFQT